VVCSLGCGGGALLGGASFVCCRTSHLAQSDLICSYLMGKRERGVGCWPHTTTETSWRGDSGDMSAHSSFSRVRKHDTSQSLQKTGSAVTGNDARGLWWA
jgi:hypothetical protein